MAFANNLLFVNGSRYYWFSPFYLSLDGTVLHKYVLLLKPNTNIPFFEEMKRLCRYEFQIMCDTLSLDIEIESLQMIGQGCYLHFSSCQSIAPFLQWFVRLSFYYTLFERTDASWRPIDVASSQVFPDDLSNRLKYSGKTNEVFTRFMINVSICSYFKRLLANHSVAQKNEFLLSSPRLSILDPLSGKGTTLFEALMFGHHAYGVEQEKSFVGDCVQFFERYLKEGKYKHQLTKGRFTVNRQNLGDMIAISLGATKQQIKAKTGQQFRLHRGDTLQTDRFFKKDFIDLIVSDLPYGVQHFNKSSTGQFRKPSQSSFLQNALRCWLKVLRSDGLVALSWNTHTLPRKSLLEVLEQHGLKAFDEPHYENFAHRVSQAIRRDFIVAYRK